MTVQKCYDASRHLLLQARDELAQGDVRQASEKGWGAAAQIVKAIAQEREQPHRAHGHVHHMVTQLVRDTGDFDIRRRFQIAESLHTNFYERELDQDQVAGLLDGSPHDTGNLPGTASATHILAHSNQQDQQKSNGARVVFAPAPP